MNMQLKIVLKVGFRIVVIFLYLTGISNALASDQCSDILMQGIKDEYNFTSSQNIQEATYQAVCHKKHSNRESSSGFSFSIPLPELKSILGFGSSNSNISSKRSDFCNTTSTNINKDTATNFAKSVANPLIVKAWESCMSSRGLYCQSENLGNNHFKVKVTWNPSVIADAPIIQGDLTVIGGECKKLALLKNGNQIQEKASIIEVCERDGNTPGELVFAFLNTTQGGLECVIPKLIKPLKPSEFLNECVNGNYDGCAGLKLQAMQKYQQCLDLSAANKENLSDSERQEIISTERECGNRLGQTTFTMTLIERIWDSCRVDAREPDKCRQAKQTLATRL